MEITQIKNIVSGIRKYYPVSDASIQELTGFLVPHQFYKGQLLTRSGIKDSFVYFIEQGCSRTYFLIDGKEVTNWFSTEGDITFSSGSLYHHTAGNDYVEILEASVVYAIAIKDLDYLYRTNIEIANWGRCIHQEVLLQMQNLRLDRLSLSATERYRKLWEQRPELFNRVNLGYIASYLGMSQQHLSSLRSSVIF